MSGALLCIGAVMFEKTTSGVSVPALKKEVCVGAPGAWFNWSGESPNKTCVVQVSLSLSVYIYSVIVFYYSLYIYTIIGVHPCVHLCGGACTFLLLFHLCV